MKNYWNCSTEIRNTSPLFAYCFNHFDEIRFSMRRFFLKTAARHNFSISKVNFLKSKIITMGWKWLDYQKYSRIISMNSQQYSRIQNPWGWRLQSGSRNSQPRPNWISEYWSFIQGWATYGCNIFHDRNQIYLEWNIRLGPNMLAMLITKGLNMLVTSNPKRIIYACKLQVAISFIMGQIYLQCRKSS